MNEADKLLAEVKDSMVSLRIEQSQAERDSIRDRMQQPDFWQDAGKAQELSKREASLTKSIEPWKELLVEAELIVELAKSGESDFQTELSTAQKKYSELRKQLQFKGPYDDHDVILNIYAGAGGTDAQDWAQMLLRMYTRWAEAHDGKIQFLDQSGGDEAGIKSATLKITGIDHLYGKLAGEHGVHRLVRKSPFNSAGSRETSFARVDVLPVIDEPKELGLDDKDLKVDVFRSGGAGGQSVNTTDSAVRITHLPTGITISIQNERSQLQNKETALAILRSKLIQLQLEQHAENIAELKGPTSSAEWGNQTRNYILDDRIIKDLRSGWYSHDPGKVLDGDLDPLITAHLER